MVTLTANAARQLQELVQQDPQASGLRLEVIQGGCSGFEYSLSLGTAHDGDEVVEAHGASVIIDRLSLPYLLGAEVDYEESFQGAGFVIHNPNATGACGCGKSFNA
ncbi:MAG: iron-sulfur cluster assembly accessory protein [Thermoleophilia bacterium]